MALSDIEDKIKAQNEQLAEDATNKNNSDIGRANAEKLYIKNSLKLDNLAVADSKGTVKEEATYVNNSISAPDSIIRRYGIRQEVVTQQKNQDARITVSRKLNENCQPKETLEVECIGDINYKVGYGVHVLIPYIPKYNDCLMYIKTVNHEWKSDGTFISTLELTPSRVMDIKEWTDTSNQDSSTSTMDATVISKIIALLKQQQGIPYLWGGTSPSTGFDCSGLVQYCFNQYKDETGVTLGRSTYEQVAQGTEVSTSDRSAWQAGDLIFPHSGHVTVYLGDGEVIHAPHTGDVVKIANYASCWNTVYAVRRIVDASLTTNDVQNSDSSVPEDYASGLTYVQGNCDTFISNMVYYDFKSFLRTLSNGNGIDPYIIAAIIAIESEGNPYCITGSYRGLMQVENGTTDDMGANIQKGINDFKEKKDAVGGSSAQLHVILSAYNSGQNTVQKACEKADIDESTCTIKQLGDAIYAYNKSTEGKYYASKVIKAMSILKAANALN